MFLPTEPLMSVTIVTLDATTNVPVPLVDVAWRDVNDEQLEGTLSLTATVLISHQSVNTTASALSKNFSFLL